MTSNIDFNFEAIVFDYIDEFKVLFFPEQWSNNPFFDYSKNELLALIFLYRKKSANMTELSNYMHAPLNTVTGVIGRLEKKKMVERNRDDSDRRIVNIVLTAYAEEFLKQGREAIEYYFKEIYKVLSEEEKAIALNIITKVVSVIKKSNNETNTEEKKEKKVRRINIE